MTIKKDDGESILLAELNGATHKILFEKNLNLPRYSASLAKVYLASEFVRLLEDKKIINKVIKIKKDDLAGYGTDVLSDLVAKNNSIKIDALTLLGLMIKYSCNSSALVLTKHFLPNRKILQERAREIWGLENVTLISKNGKIMNDFSLKDFLLIFQKIFSSHGQGWDFLKSKLKTSRNIYYLFDQMELDILGTKSGTKKLGQIYWISDCGIFRLGRKTYFMGAMVSDKRISKAVLRIREIGKDLIVKLN